ncbi:MAG: peptidoglycan DD-metalloendopeptidase family protein, partial [Limnoraphis robusta]
AVALWLDLQREYNDLGGSGSWLGFPTRREYDWNGGKRTDFEGGYIYWDGQRAKAYHLGESPQTQSSPEQDIAQKFLYAASLYPQVGNAITDVQDQGGGVFRQEFERAIMIWNGQQVTIYETKGRSASPTSPSSEPQVNNPSGFNPVVFTRSVGVDTNYGIRLRTDTNLNAPGESVTYDSQIEFDGWKYGEPVQDQTVANGQMDALWYRIKGTSYWIPSAFINGYPPGYQQPGSSAGNTGNTGGSQPILNFNSGGNSSNGNWTFLSSSSSSSSAPPQILPLGNVYNYDNYSSTVIAGGKIEVSGKFKDFQGANFYLNGIQLGGSLSQSMVWEDSVEFTEFTALLNVPVSMSPGTYKLRVEVGNNQGNVKLASPNQVTIIVPLHQNPTESNPLKGFVPPLKGEVKFVQSWYNSPSGARSHQGLLNKYGFDFSNKIGIGSDVYAMRSGKVIKVEMGFEDKGGGPEKANQANLVYIQHDNGYVSHYLHLQKNSVVVKVGEEVVAGQKIAAQGNSGWSEATHLHISVHNSLGNSVAFEIPGVNPMADIWPNTLWLNLS